VPCHCVSVEILDPSAVRAKGLSFQFSNLIGTHQRHIYIGF
jgi:hypothetical protein